MREVLTIHGKSGRNSNGWGDGGRNSITDAKYVLLVEDSVQSTAKNMDWERIQMGCHVIAPREGNVNFLFSP